MEQDRKNALFLTKPDRLIIRKHKYSGSQDLDKENKKPNYSILKKWKRSMIQKKVSLIKQMLTYPKTDNSILIQDIKCFMSCKHQRSFHNIDSRLLNRAIGKILSSDRILVSYEINYDKIEKLIESIHHKQNNSELLLENFEQIWANSGKEYPPTVQLMLSYFGAFLYAVNGQYSQAENYSQKMFDIIIRFKAEQFFMIYLLLRIKLKANLYEWQEAVKYLTKLLQFAWMYSLSNLQIWCYFEFSRAYFFMQRQQQAQIFRIKSEANSTESRKSIYREVCIGQLIDEIENIWEGKLDFNFKEVVQSNRLKVPQFEQYKVEQFIKDQKKLKSSIKNITHECRIRHVSNLLNRVSQIGHHQLYQEQYGKPLGNRSGNNFLLTHKSFNKNMNMFFRNKSNNTKPIYYTIENSQKNWTTLKDMLRNIVMQMNHYCPVQIWEQKSVRS